MEFKSLKKRYWGQHLWSSGYFCRSVGTVTKDIIKEYINKTNRRVTFEYIMLDNVNDSEENAKELAALLKGINCYVNLIPYRNRIL